MDSQEPNEPLRVLVVEDRADNRDSLVLLLRLWGHEPFPAGDGEEALRMAEEHAPRVAILDLGLPRIDGLQVAARLRQAPELKGICLIATTGHAGAQTAARAKAAGFGHVLIKPFDPTELERLLCACVAESRS